MVDEASSKFMIPGKRDIRKITVVTFTTMAYLLENEGMKGLFTHILIDEAAQALECEVLIPLTVATEKTCVVLAGDHRQMRPEVYSTAAKRKGFHRYGHGTFFCKEITKPKLLTPFALVSINSMQFCKSLTYLPDHCWRDCTIFIVSSIDRYQATCFP
jgi:hypothetical protein